MRRSRELLFNADTQKLELLLTPLNRLNVKLAGSFLEEAIRISLADLKRVRINRLQPFFYLSTGYGTVAGTTSISLGFYDVNELLQDLNYECRGFRYSNQEIIDIVRHELGHAFSYAYKLYRRKDFRAVFRVKGNYFNTYPVTERYVRRANPWSRDFVNPGGDYYAQKHPDDDFAETFMVWLQPRYNWRREYRFYPGALRKLEFVEFVVNELRREEPLIDQKPEIFEPLEEFDETLAHFLRLRSTQAYRRKATGYIDPDLKNLFYSPRAGWTRQRQREYVHADAFIREHKRQIVAQVSRWVTVDERAVVDFVDKCSARTRALNLWVRKDDRDRKLIELTTYISYRGALFALYERYLDPKSRRAARP